MPLNPVALAALEALSESEWESQSESQSSSGTSIDDSMTNDDGMKDLDMDSDYEFKNDNDIPDTDDDDDDSPLKMVDYSPIKKEELLSVSTKSNANRNGSSKKKRKRDCDKSNIQNNNSSNNNSSQYPLSHLKPFFDVGTAVYGPWWTGTVRQEFCDQWFPGTISSFKEVPTSSPYGPLRLYTIEYDDGDVLKDVHDHFVFSKEDYLLHDRSLRGVRCEADSGSADDKWAKVVGWYVVTIDGVDVQFARLADAMEAYDNHTIQQEGANIQSSDLNRPEKYPELFASSSTKRGKKTPRSASSKTISRSSLPHGLSSSASESKTPRTKNTLSNDLPLGFSPSSSDSDFSAKQTKRGGNPRRTSTSSSSSSSSTSPNPTSRKNRQIEKAREPKAWQSSTSSSMTTTKTPEPIPAQRNYLKKKLPPDESIISAVTPKTAPRKRQKKSTPPASKYQGVSYSKGDKKYLAQLEYKNKFISLGLYKFEADAALAYDMGRKLLSKHQDDVPTVASHSDHHSLCNFVWRESYEESIHEEMTNAKRKRINVEKSYSKVSEMVEVCLSKIFIAEQKKLRDSLDNDQSCDRNGVMEFAMSMHYDEKDTSTEFESSISAPTMETSTVDSGDDNDGIEGTTNYDSIDTRTDFELTISAPILDNAKDDDLRNDENDVPLSQSITFTKKHDYYCVEYDKVSKSFMSYISLPKTETRAEINYWLGSYKLEADAALACDKAAVLLQIKTVANFPTTQEYNAARQYELDATNCSDADLVSSLEIATRVFENIMYRMNTLLTKKWENYLQATKDRSDFLHSYQASIHEILNGGGYDQSSGSVRHEEYCEDDLEESEDIASSLSDGQSGGDDSDDDASLFSDSSQMTPQGCL